jgi:hypothetical protein
MDWKGAVTTENIKDMELVENTTSIKDMELVVLTSIKVMELIMPCWLLQERAVLIAVGDLVNIATEDISGDQRIAPLLANYADVVQEKITLQVFAGIKRRQ